MTPMLGSVFDSFMTSVKIESVQRRDQLSKLTQNEQGLSQKNTELKAMQQNLARHSGALDVQKQSLQELSQKF